MDPDIPFSREDILSGSFRGRRVMRLVSGIESQTIYLKSQVQWAVEILLNPGARGTQAYNPDLLYQHYREHHRATPLTALDLERYALQWANLILADSKVKATVSHLLAQKYTLAYQTIPVIRQVLGLDTDAVQQAYQTLYHVPLQLYLHLKRLMKTQ